MLRDIAIEIMEDNIKLSIKKNDSIRLYHWQKQLPSVCL